MNIHQQSKDWNDQKLICINKENCEIDETRMVKMYLMHIEASF
jgi:hypothetical protein